MTSKNDIKMLLEHKVKSLDEKLKLYERGQLQVENSTISIPLPKAISLGGNISENFNLFDRSKWNLESLWE